MPAVKKLRKSISFFSSKNQLISSRLFLLLNISLLKPFRNHTLYIRPKLRQSDFYGSHACVNSTGGDLIFAPRQPLGYADKVERLKSVASRGVDGIRCFHAFEFLPQIAIFGGLAFGQQCEQLVRRRLLTFFFIYVTAYVLSGRIASIDLEQIMNECHFEHAVKVNTVESTVFVQGHGGGCSSACQPRLGSGVGLDSVHTA